MTLPQLTHLALGAGLLVAGAANPNPNLAPVPPHPAAAPEMAPAAPWVIPAGSTVIYNTANGPVNIGLLHVQPGATLRFEGPQRAEVHASRGILLEGTIDASGRSNPGVLTLNTTNFPEPGALGGPSGGQGGTGSQFVNQATPRGSAGAASPLAAFGGGGKGGESGYGSSQENGRRPGGGGGGAFGPDEPVFPGDPTHPVNIGLVALGGVDGSSTAFGAHSGASTPSGGRAGRRPFVDGDPSNDFWGTHIDPVTGAVTIGELAAPTGGSGGGAGGDASSSTSWPTQPFQSTGDEKGAGGGGGGGLLILETPVLRLRGDAKIICNGGRGGGGENTSFLNRIGGGSGGGSGGMILVQARKIDLRMANILEMFTARGGAGGPGSQNKPLATNAGGHGGPGLIQFHVPSEGDVLLPPLAQIRDVSTPTAHVLQPQPIP